MIHEKNTLNNMKAAVASKNVNMNSTNESSFTEQHNYSHQLIASNLEAASSLSMGSQQPINIASVNN